MILGKRAASASSVLSAMWSRPDIGRISLRPLVGDDGAGAGAGSASSSIATGGAGEAASSPGIASLHIPAAIARATPNAAA